MKFLGDLWGDDTEAMEALQEFFGYTISGRTDLHKILLLVGPLRSGKGTIARVLTSLIGKPNVTGPTLASLGINPGSRTSSASPRPSSRMPGLVEPT